MSRSSKLDCKQSALQPVEDFTVNLVDCTIPKIKITVDSSPILFKVVSTMDNKNTNYLPPLLDEVILCNRSWIRVVTYLKNLR